MPTRRFAIFFCTHIRCVGIPSLFAGAVIDNMLAAGLAFVLANKMLDRLQLAQKAKTDNNDTE